MLSRQIYKEEQRQFEKQIKQVENKRSNEYHLNSMGKMTIPNQTNFVWKDREDSWTYFGVPYRTEMQTLIVRWIHFRETSHKRKSQSREVKCLDSKHLERQELREPSQDRYDDQR